MNEKRGEFSYASQLNIEDSTTQMYNLSKLRILFAVYLLNIHCEEVTSRKICDLTQIKMKNVSELLRRYSKQDLLIKKFSSKSKKAVYSYKLTTKGEI